MAVSNDNFFERVYQIVRQIPEGRVTSYGAIAKALGAARSSRMVGWAMNASHGVDDVPAHRVVNRKGLLTGKHHFDGTSLPLGFTPVAKTHTVTLRSASYRCFCFLESLQQLERHTFRLRISNRTHSWYWLVLLERLQSVCSLPRFSW
jgi:methylated-DNA-protein-cysteine methyltransferase-like protein